MQIENKSKLPPDLNVFKNFVMHIPLFFRIAWFFLELLYKIFFGAALQNPPPLFDLKLV